MTDKLELTAKIVAAHVAHNNVEEAELPELIKAVFDALSKATQPEEAKTKEPAVPIRKSVFNDHLICLECGKELRVLKRHLHTDHNLTIDEYRERYSLPRDYPMVAAEYAETRSRLAKEAGLARKAPAKRGRKRA